MKTLLKAQSKESCRTYFVNVLMLVVTVFLAVAAFFDARTNWSETRSHRPYIESLPTILSYGWNRYALDANIKNVGGRPISRGTILEVYPIAIGTENGELTSYIFDSPTIVVIGNELLPQQTGSIHVYVTLNPAQKPTFLIVKMIYKDDILGHSYEQTGFYEWSIPTQGQTLSYISDNDVIKDMDVEFMKTTKKRNESLGAQFPFVEGFVTYSDGTTERFVFTDVPNNAWYANAVRYCAEIGVVNGYRDVLENTLNEYRPANTVSRAEFLKMVTKLMWQRYHSESFAIKPGDHWYETYLRAVLSKDPQLPKVMPIDATSLNQPILRHEAVGLLHLSLGKYNTSPPFNPHPFQDVTRDMPNYNAITEFQVEGVISGSGGKIFPNQLINRAEAAALIYRTMGAYQATSGSGSAQ